MMITNNIGQVAYLNAKLHNCTKIFFVGSFLRHNSVSCRRLAFAIDFWSKGEMEALFLHHEGYFGALGTFLQSAFGNDLDSILGYGNRYNNESLNSTLSRNNLPTGESISDLNSYYQYKRKYQNNDNNGNSPHTAYGIDINFLKFLKDWKPPLTFNDIKKVSAEKLTTISESMYRNRSNTQQANNTNNNNTNATNNTNNNATTNTTNSAYSRLNNSNSSSNNSKLQSTASDPNMTSETSNNNNNNNNNNTSNSNKSHSGYSSPVVDRSAPPYNNSSSYLDNDISSNSNITDPTNTATTTIATTSITAGQESKNRSTSLPNSPSSLFLSQTYHPMSNSSNLMNDNTTSTTNNITTSTNIPSTNGTSIYQDETDDDDNFDRDEEEYLFNSTIF